MEVTLKVLAAKQFRSCVKLASSKVQLLPIFNRKDLLKKGKKIQEAVKSEKLQLYKQNLNDNEMKRFENQLNAAHEIGS